MTLDRHAARWILSLALAGELHAGCCQPPPASPRVPQGGYEFDEYEIVLGSTARQTVLAGFFLDGAMADVVVLTVGPQGVRDLRMDSFTGSEFERRYATLRAGVSFVDVGRIGGRERLLTYAAGRLSWFDPESDSEHTLVEVSTSFVPPRQDEVAYVNITEDLNDDGRDDLVLPVVDGFLVFVQREDGSFEESLTVGPRPRLARIYGADGYRYDPWSQSRIHRIDHDLDGRKDLAHWNGDHFLVHLQEERGSFDPVARSFTTEVPFDSDDIDFLAVGDEAGRVLVTLTDLNGDGLADMGILSLQGKRLSKKRSRYEVHFGRRSPDGSTHHVAEPDATFRSKDRILIDVAAHDLDHDGRMELMITALPIEFLGSSLWKRIKGAMGDDVWMDLEFYRLSGGNDSSRPAASIRTGLDGAPSHREPGWVPLALMLRGGKHERRRQQGMYPRAFNPMAHLADLNGDGHAELIRTGHPRAMSISMGVPGPRLFAEPPLDVRTLIPNDEEYAQVIDLDRDGKQDLLFHHPFTEKMDMEDGCGERAPSLIG